MLNCTCFYKTFFEFHHPFNIGLRCRQLSSYSMGPTFNASANALRCGRKHFLKATLRYSVAVAVFERPMLIMARESYRVWNGCYACLPAWVSKHLSKYECSTQLASRFSKKTSCYYTLPHLYSGRKEKKRHSFTSF